MYTTEIVIEEQEFAESKAAQSGQQNTQPAKEEEGMDGFMNIPEGIDENLPFV